MKRLQQEERADNTVNGGAKGSKGQEQHPGNREKRKEAKEQLNHQETEAERGEAIWRRERERQQTSKPGKR